MHPTASLTALLALAVSAAAFLSGFGPRDESLAGKSLAQRGIAAEAPALVTAVREGDRTVTRLLLHGGVDTDARDQHGRTPLMLALEGRRPDLARDLMQAGADLTARDEEGQAVICYAVRAGESSIVAALLDRGVDPNTTVPGGASLVVEAMKAGRIASAKLLLDAGASVWNEGTSQSDLMVQATRRGVDWMVERLLGSGVPAGLRSVDGEPLMHVALRERNADFLGLFRTRGADPDARNSGGETALHVALLEGHSDLLPALLVNGASVELPHPSGWMPLHFALERGDWEAVRVLLRAGADPNAKGSGERSPMDLLLATESSAEQMEMLLDAGADPNVNGPDGRTPFEVVLSRRDFRCARLLLDHQADPGGALHNAAVEGDAETFAFLLENEVDPNGSATDCPLAAAVRGGHAWMVTRLLEAGAATDLPGREGQSALHLAVAMNRADLTELLLAAGADPDEPYAEPVSPEFLGKVRGIGYIKWQFGTDSGILPIMVAADSGNLQLARILLDHGAHKDVPTKRKGYIPLEFAARRGDVKMMQLLLDRDPDEEERWIKVDLSAQWAWVYNHSGKTLLSTRISSGKQGFRTRAGEYVITNKIRDHVSTLYPDSEMPFFQRLNCGDFGLHEGPCPGHAASHGCVRVPRGKAGKLWTLTRTGDRVVIVR